MTHLAELQRLIEATRAERGFTSDPARLVCLLTEEVGEVAAEIKKTWSANYPGLNVADLGDELADALVILSAIASTFEIDLEDAVRSKFLTTDGRRTWATAATNDPSAPGTSRPPGARISRPKS